MRRKTRDRITALLLFSAPVVAAAIDVNLAPSGQLWPLLALSGVPVSAVAAPIAVRRNSGIVLNVAVTALFMLPLILWLGTQVARGMRTWPTPMRFVALVVGNAICGSWLFAAGVAFIYLLPLSIAFRRGP